MKKILLVDDNKSILYALKRVLEKNYEVYGVDSGRKALNFLRKKKPNVIILDLMMPGMDGWTVYDKIRKNDKTKSIPVIFATAVDEKATISTADVKKISKIKLTSNNYVQKPFTFKDIDKRIKKILGGKRK